MLTPLLIVITVFIALFLTISLVRKRSNEKHLSRLQALARIAPIVNNALDDISNYYHSSHYITESERLDLLEKYDELFQDISMIISTKELKESTQKEIIQRFYNAMSNSSEHKKTNNQHFIKNQLFSYSDYFDTVLSHPLDAQQREAIVSLEDNVLVISSAGSGKTMTTVGKVRYLIDIHHVPPEKILLITFTNKASESLTKRLAEPNLKCRTFHKLAIDIIGDFTGKKPSIVGQDFSAQVYHSLFQEDEHFRCAIADYIIHSRYKMKSQYEYSSSQEYMLDRQKYGIQAMFKDKDGRPVFCKSDEESQICDFLGSRGIQFKYEQKYEFDTGDNNHRQYCPDFSIYIPQENGNIKRVYLEHFAVDENGQCPPFFSPEESDLYHEGMSWKRAVHDRHGTKLLVTTSGNFHKGDVFRVLADQLKNEGAVLSTAGNKIISRELNLHEESILNMLTAFNFLSKSRAIDIQEIGHQLLPFNDRLTLNELVIPYVDKYRQMEQESETIDFTDSIIRATDICNSGFCPDYDYILVDEFQDMSMDRYRFLQALRRKDPLTKLFCVGDDWQSIYRFAGSDMALFKHFENFFGFTKKCFMETTYRFGEPAISVSSKFILANPEQEKKVVHSFNSELNTRLDFLHYNDLTDEVDLVKSLIDDKIPPEKEVLLLGRYSFDVNIFKNRKDFLVHDGNKNSYLTYNSRKIRFLTVHKSKGLESDFIILLNCHSGTKGFPADIADNPILRYVLSEPEEFAFSEERRLFYVGITRAKEHTWVLYDKNNPSSFISEFVKIDSQESHSNPVIPENQRCPKCKCGRIIELKKGKATNGNPYTVWGCSNEKYGCDYRETVFVNLNNNKQEARKHY